MLHISTDSPLASPLNSELTSGPSPRPVRRMQGAHSPPAARAPTLLRGLPPPRSDQPLQARHTPLEGSAQHTPLLRFAALGAAIPQVFATTVGALAPSLHPSFSLAASIVAGVAGSFGLLSLGVGAYTCEQSRRALRRLQHVRHGIALRQAALFATDMRQQTGAKSHLANALDDFDRVVGRSIATQRFGIAIPGTMQMVCGGVTVAAQVAAQAALLGFVVPALTATALNFASMLAPAAYAIALAINHARELVHFTWACKLLAAPAPDDAYAHAYNQRLQAQRAYHAVSVLLWATFAAAFTTLGTMVFTTMIAAPPLWAALTITSGSVLALVLSCICGNQLTPHTLISDRLDREYVTHTGRRRALYTALAHKSERVEQAAAHQAQGPISVPARFELNLVRDLIALDLGYLARNRADMDEVTAEQLSQVERTFAKLTAMNLRIEELNKVFDTLVPLGPDESWSPWPGSLWDTQRNDLRLSYATTLGLLHEFLPKPFLRQAKARGWIVDDIISDHGFRVDFQHAEAFRDGYRALCASREFDVDSAFTKVILNPGRLREEMLQLLQMEQASSNRWVWGAGSDPRTPRVPDFA